MPPPPIIPNLDRANPRFDRGRYRERNIIERVVGWLKESRRLATRYEKLAVNFLAVVKLAMFQCCLRALDSSNRAWKLFWTCRVSGRTELQMQMRPLTRDLERLPQTLAGLHYLAFARLVLLKVIDR